MKSAAIFTTLAALTLMGGCYAPNNGGGVFSKPGGACTYYSSQLMQKTITLVDMRNNESVFAVDVPPDKQLTMVFEEGKGDDPVYTPDLMRYEVLDQGTGYGTLHNAMSVPNAACRRVDVTMRRGVEYAAQTPPRQLRTDETADRPAWWTSKGGPIPSTDAKRQMYDN